ncbi:toll/interleukin-1 receptor domain-containing protein [Desulfopila sp. IMCC35006]|uniref:toll/interleukin-1 receptor domain-containing protein n=1 Tax=Desulfopila sp. IMCC35006 TaxID=2569542 RepID=UPI0010ACB999|nr:toll/interleukin-1 receptor domain-containing protein [Desulfopila sp. IMCC35006]TKB23482.1 toll/interleukin-1 receptor domain-containing protein [Desulfopila sp. IMCC35006]
MHFNIFVSYSTLDLPHVELLEKQLKNTFINVFVAEHSVKPSEDLSKKIENAIRQSDLFVLLWSKNAKESEWVSQEIGKATAFNKTILPLVLDKGLKLPAFISELKYIPVYKDASAALIQAKAIADEQCSIKFAKLQEDKKKKDQELLIKLGLGGALLWLFNQS